MSSLSTNECQAEVAFTVLALCLKRLHLTEVARLKQEAMVIFADIGDKDILAEAKSFFRQAER